MSGSENKESLTVNSQPMRSQTSEMRFGNTTYVVTTIFDENARETIEQKFIKHVSDRILNGYKTPPTQ